MYHQGYLFPGTLYALSRHEFRKIAISDLSYNENIHVARLWTYVRMQERLERRRRGIGAGLKVALGFDFIRFR